MNCIFSLWDYKVTRMSTSLSQLLKQFNLSKLLNSSKSDEMESFMRHIEQQYGFPTNSKNAKQCRYANDKLTALTFNETSVNCIHNVNADVFTKVQLLDIVDPLENEVAITTYLNDIHKQHNWVFVEYVDHFLVNQVPGRVNNKECKVLQTKAIKGIQSAIDRRKADPSKFFLELHKFMVNYVTQASDAGFVHNDMHFNNVVCDQQFNYYLIDYGRSFIDFCVSKEPTKELASKYCTSPYAWRDRVSKFFSHNHNVQDSAFGYMCDIATLSLNALALHGVDFIDKFISSYNIKWLSLNVNTQHLTIYPQDIDTSFSNNPNQVDDWFTRGIAFMAMYLAHAASELGTVPTTVTLPLQTKNPAEPGVYGGYLFDNGVIRGTIYNGLMRKVPSWLPSIFGVKQITGGKRKIRNSYQGGSQQKVTMTIKPVQKDMNINFENLPEVDMNSAFVKNLCTPTVNFIVAEEIRRKQGVNLLPKLPSMANLADRQLMAMNTRVPVSAIGGARSYKISTERYTERKYAMVGRTKFYLDENRGRFKYSNKARTEIMLRVKNM